MVFCTVFLNKQNPYCILYSVLKHIVTKYIGIHFLLIIRVSGEWWNNITITESGLILMISYHSVHILSGLGGDQEIWGRSPVRISIWMYALNFFGEKTEHIKKLIFNKWWMFYTYVILFHLNKKTIFISQSEMPLFVNHLNWHQDSFTVVKGINFNDINLKHVMLSKYLLLRIIWRGNDQLSDIA